MLVKQELINRIKDYFDLNIYETKVWLALLGKGVATAGQIAEISNVPRSRTYDVLESLEKKGFALIKLGKPVKYLGVKPHMILEKLKNNVRSEAEERLVTFSKIRSTEEFIKLEEMYKQGLDPVKREEISAALNGRSNITNHLREILKNATNEVIICTSVSEASSKLKLFQQTIETLKKANIKIKFALSGEEKLVKKIEAALKVKIKKVDIQAKFFIIDRKEMLFYISKDPKTSKLDIKDSQEDIAVWLNSEFFAQAFASLFEKAVGED